MNNRKKDLHERPPYNQSISYSHLCFEISITNILLMDGTEEAYSAFQKTKGERKCTEQEN